MFGNFNIKSVLTYEWKIFYFKTTKIDLDLDNMNPKINNNYALSSGNHCTKFGDYQANGIKY